MFEITQIYNFMHYWKLFHWKNETSQNFNFMTWFEPKTLEDNHK